MDEMYRELILDHAQNGRNWGLLDPNDFDHEELNPLCGDRLRLTLRVAPDDTIAEVGWDGHGCAISQATASMLGEQLVGMTLDEAKALNRDDIFDLLGFPLTMNRMKCALLPLKTLLVGAAGIDHWEKVEDE